MTSQITSKTTRDYLHSHGWTYLRGGPYCEGWGLITEQNGVEYEGLTAHEAEEVTRKDKGISMGPF
ncbi:MAG: hypothetical protein GWN30_20610 [Gammaproteobacteria bacterium]|nr:hypothetical protein [Gammaproteobacteria bacterium]NIX00620.1 hypothetical protein [Phycisphaerae bacterium]